MLTVRGFSMLQSHRMRMQKNWLLMRIPSVFVSVRDWLRPWVQWFAAPKISLPKPEEPEEKSEIYEIVSGDTLGGIAKKYYGKAGAYMKIFEANRDIISDPNKIYPGQKIRIPLD